MTFFTFNSNPKYTGFLCETEISLNPLCENNGPCLNNGICKVIPGTSKIECDCAYSGFSGNRCEVEFGFFSRTD